MPEFDPTKALASLRADVQEALHIAYDVGADDADVPALLTTIAEAFDNLDVHITDGGALPDDWAEFDT